MNAAKSFEATLHLRLKQSELYQIYKQAFQTATGLPLRLVGADPDHWCLDGNITNRSPFCEHLNLCDSACVACVETNRRLMHEVEVGGPTTCHCFAGLTSTAVPVKMGATLIGFLRTGQVFTRTPDEKSFLSFLGKLGRKQLSAESEHMLRHAYFQTQTVDPERYDSMVKLLESFSRQLGQHAESLAIIEAGKEPRAVTRARKYIHQHLNDSLTLGQIARVAGLSESHFCRQFREATGLTLTDYINRSRVEWAKKELLKPDLRVSEIAFRVGYQSLSQFNRSFVRITGTSPTRWRQQQLRHARKS